MIASQLFPANKTPSAPSILPTSVSSAILAGYAAPSAKNPFLWSSTLWEAFHLGQYLASRSVSVEGFRKSRACKYGNKKGLVVRYHYFLNTHSFGLSANW